MIHISRAWIFFKNRNNSTFFIFLKIGHSSEIRGLFLMKWPCEMLQNLPYFGNTKTHIVFFVFQFALIYFFPNECPVLCWHERKNKVARNEKRKKLCRFSYSKNMANFEAFHQVISSSINLFFLNEKFSLEETRALFLWILSATANDFPKSSNVGILLYVTNYLIMI